MLTSQKFGHLWDAPQSVIVKRNPRELAGAVEPLLSSAKKIKFVDPNFRPDAPRYRESFGEFLKAIIRHRKSPLDQVEIHTRVNFDHQFFKKDCKEKFQKIIPAGMTVKFVRWSQKDGGQSLHNRYILTEIGGVSFHHGLDRGREDDTDDISLLSGESLIRWFEVYSEDTLNPCFDFPEAPFSLMGVEE